jgi:hypothetical protein
LLELRQKNLIDTASKVNAYNTTANRAFRYLSVRVFPFKIADVFNNSRDCFTGTVTTNVKPVFMLV